MGNHDDWEDVKPGVKLSLLLIVTQLTVFMIGEHLTWW